MFSPLEQFEIIVLKPLRLFFDFSMTNATLYLFLAFGLIVLLLKCLRISFVIHYFAKEKQFARFLYFFLKENLVVFSLIFLSLWTILIYFCGVSFVPIWTFLFFPLFFISSLRFQFFRKWSLNAMLSCLVPTFIYLRVLVIVLLGLFLKKFEVEILQVWEVFLDVIVMGINFGLTEEGLVVLPSQYKMMSGKNAVLAAFPKQPLVIERAQLMIPRIVESSVKKSFLPKFFSNNVFVENLINTSLISAVSKFNFCGKALSGETPLLFPKYFDSFSFIKAESHLVEQVDKILSESRKMGLSEVLDGNVRQNLYLISKAMPSDAFAAKKGYAVPVISRVGHIMQLQELVKSVPLDLVKLSKGPGAVLITFLDDLGSGDALSNRSSIVNKYVNYPFLIEKVAPEASTLANFISFMSPEVIDSNRPRQGDFSLRLRNSDTWVLECKAPLSFKSAALSIQEAAAQLPKFGDITERFVLLDFTKTVVGSEPEDFLKCLLTESSAVKAAKADGVKFVLFHAKGIYIL